MGFPGVAEAGKSHSRSDVHPGKKCASQHAKAQRRHQIQGREAPRRGGHRAGQGKVQASLGVGEFVHAMWGVKRRSVISELPGKTREIRHSKQADLSLIL